MKDFIARPVHILWIRVEPCECRARKEKDCAPTHFVPEPFSGRQVESTREIEACGQMADDEDAWESLYEVLARLLRKIDPSREAA